MSVGNLIKAMNKYMPDLIEQLERLNDNLEGKTHEDHEDPDEPGQQRYINGGRMK